jgi:hypothetical protein
MTARHAHVPCLLSQYTVLDVIDKLTTVKRSSFHARVGRYTAEQDVDVNQARMAFLGFGSIVENRWAAEQYAVDNCRMREDITRSSRRRLLADTAVKRTALIVGHPLSRHVTTCLRDVRS